MNILVTGSEGFIGKHVVKKLLALGHDVVGVDNLEPRVHREHSTVARIHVLKHDSYSFHGLSYDNIPHNVLREAEIVIHLAAQVGVADSMTDQVRYVEHNTMATARFLEDLARPGRLHKLVVASSMSVYGDPDTSQPIRENHGESPASVYGLTKYDQEMLCKFWGKQHDISIVALRFFNIYGPGQALNNPYTGVIANFANWLLAGERPIVYEDGQQTRDFVYVDDVADAVVKAALNPIYHDTYNICTSEPTTINYMAFALAHALDVDIIPNITGETRPGDIRHCIGNNSRFALEFDWAPRSVSEGLTLYAPWIHEQADPA
ncbi:hypothetical protein LCGC14_1702610 [marine sediment metagenome]|uniref:NAD-dependent epimerase/dehydratase domain-containing protein n=1 Tax=marine sediment metagenome TaxID=412755 RepID=A0A0F9HHZ4_9ZZZZ